MPLTITPRSTQLFIVYVAASALLAACGGGGGDVATRTSGDSSSQGAASVALSLASMRYLTIDPQQLPDYEPQLPPYYAGVADNVPAGTEEQPVMAALGRVLFYDKQLSVNGQVSCASCHNQDIGFADAARFSTGFDGTGKTTAHAMRLANLRFYAPGQMFWDKRAESLEAQSTMPVKHPVEMGFDDAHGGIPALLQRMQSLPYYPELFAGAFGDATITEPRMQEALAMFMRGIVSSHSRWDEAYAQVFDPSLPDRGLNQPLPGFTEQENRGRELFMASREQGGQACAACHQPPSFALGGSGNNGLDAGEPRRFKSPSLKNVALSKAFMHDGRFSTLEEVVEHYSSGVQDGPGLDGRLKGADGAPLKPQLSQQDKDALVAFLKTLSDPVLGSDPRFASPFAAGSGASAASAP